jgi:hypothetical protein
MSKSVAVLSVTIKLMKIFRKQFNLPDRYIEPTQSLVFGIFRFANALLDGSEIVNQSEQKYVCAVSGFLGIFVGFSNSKVFWDN